MFDLTKAIRPNVAKLNPYTSARDEFTGTANIYLDANENSYGSATPENYNRYPDPKHYELRKRVAEIKAVNPESIFIGNGSDEAIDLIIRMFCEPSKDSILTLYPSYGMYKVSADINDVKVETVNLNVDYTLDLEKLINAITSKTKVIFVCNPNNPTGNAFGKDALGKLASAAANKNAVLVIDEAYIDFCEEESMLSEISKHSNLIVLQTLSKAWGLAEIRVGLAFSTKEIINYFYKVKPPYNVNGVSQSIALQALKHTDKKKELVEFILLEKDKLISALRESGDVEKVFPSQANYIFVKVREPEEKFKELLQKGIVVRDRSKVPMCEGCFRITVGTADENEALISAFNGGAVHTEIKSSINSTSSTARIASVNRMTSETDVNIFINLDGHGHSEISTGLGFFDHMLTQVSKHSGIDLNISVKGDLHIDEHHTIEDTAIALGEVFLKALGNKAGIKRYGFLLPMDECLAQVALDLSGRSHLVWNAQFSREKIGDMPTEMFSHFFKSFSDSAKCNLNIQASGENEHHKIESIFKAFAKCIMQAIERNPRRSEIPSSKGVL